MKTFALPKSDCGYFVVGQIGPDCFEPQRDKPLPLYGVIVWYESKELAHAAAVTVTDAHWESPQASDHQNAGVPNTKG